MKNLGVVAAVFITMLSMIVLAAEDPPAMTDGTGNKAIQYLASDGTTRHLSLTPGDISTDLRWPWQGSVKNPRFRVTNPLDHSVTESDFILVQATDFSVKRISLTCDKSVPPTPDPDDKRRKIWCRFKVADADGKSENPPQIALDLLDWSHRAYSVQIEDIWEFPGGPAMPDISPTFYVEHR